MIRKTKYMEQRNRMGGEDSVKMAKEAIIVGLCRPTVRTLDLGGMESHWRALSRVSL